MAGFTLFGPTHHLLALSMRLRGARHELLSANIANADTPGYQPRDIDFDAVLRSLTQPEPSGPQSEGRIQLIAAQPIYLPLTNGGVASANGHPGEERLDGNAVSLDRQMAMLTENALLYETSLTLLSRQLAALRYVIGEGRR